MDPVDALNEIGFWLERERASTYKVQAYRNAASSLAGLTGSDVATRVRDGSLTEIKGIGAKTFEVIADTVRSGSPRYLDELRSRGDGPLTPGGESLRPRLRGDLHSHSDWSDGGSPIEEMAVTARRLGREYQAITDHSPRLTVANGLSAERLAEQLDVVADLSARWDDFALLPGIEVDILDDGSLDQSAGMLGRLDVVVASVHSKLRMDAEQMTYRMVGAISNPFTNVLGHCTGRLVEGNRGIRPESSFDAEVVFAACVQFDVAVEINSRPERRDPPSRLLAVAVEAGCLFSIDTDAHAPGQLDFLDYGAARAVEYGIPVDRIVTTWPLDRLLTWTHARR
jgi:putative hydrolase